MERKRKLPPRAAARADHVAKKRNITPSVDSSSKSRSQTPQPGSAAGGASGGHTGSARNTPALDSQQPTSHPPLPKSLQPGKPLPTVEHPQPDDLSSKEFQSISESGVLSDSLSRSRQKWTDGLFEKYWTKPSKRKGVVEDPKNPAKDTMHKVGLVTVTVEPHVFEATMYTVKDPRPDPPAPSSRPYLQYGPPNGVMPPPSAPRSATPATPSASATSSTTLPASQPPIQKGPAEDLGTKVKQEPDAEHASAQRNAPLQSPPAPSRPITSPRGMESVLSPPPAPSTSQRATSTQRPPTGVTNPSPALSIASITSPAPAAGPSEATVSAPPVAPAASPASAPASRPTTASGLKPGQDPIIVTLAEKASSDAELRELMKRVATGEAPKEELANFQKIIDRITMDHKLKGGETGPSAERLIVEGKSVKYYADELHTILGIVLRSNPRQRGADLKAPPDSNPLIIAVLRKALDDSRLQDKIRRISQGKPLFHDATELKATLDAARTGIKNKPPTPATKQAQSKSQSPAPSTSSQSIRVKAPPQQQQQQPPPPPPAPPKRDISNVVFEFAGGSGDRYLFPKFAILDPQHPGTQVQATASFLLVRKGSTSEYGGDPALDYYQPVTIRIFAHSAKHLEPLYKVVAPRDEVQRYMEDVMENMTRAEYVLLAMQLPREEKKEDGSGKGQVNGAIEEGAVNGHAEKQQKGGSVAPKAEPGLASGGPAIIHQPTPPAVLWKATPPPLRPSPVVRKAVHSVGGAADDDVSGYQALISKVGKKAEEVV